MNPDTRDTLVLMAGAVLVVTCIVGFAVVCVIGLLANLRLAC
jgi:hypothetical protein